MTQPPEPQAFTKKEWQLIQSLRTPRQVQTFLSSLPYNWERDGGTQRSFREVVKRGEAHCMEAALVAAVILEQHGYQPWLMSLESWDLLDHVIFIFQHNGLWGSVARSRDLGLHGRKPVFRNLRQLAWSYYDPYVDLTGRLIGYGKGNLYDLGNYDWRFSSRNLWKVEDYLREIPHRKLRSSNNRYQSLHERYKEFKAKYPDRQAGYYDHRERWMI